jgi:hypothetical protein
MALSGDGGDNRSSSPTGSSRDSGAGNNSASSGNPGGGFSGSSGGGYSSHHSGGAGSSSGNFSGGGSGAGGGQSSGARSGGSSQSGGQSSHAAERGRDTSLGGGGVGQASGARSGGSTGGVQGGVQGARSDTPSPARSLASGLADVGRRTTSTVPSGFDRGPVARASAVPATGVNPLSSRFGREINQERFAPGITPPGYNATDAVRDLGNMPVGTFNPETGQLNRTVNSRALAMALGALERTSPRGSRFGNLPAGTRPEPATGMSFPAAVPSAATAPSLRTRMQSVARPTTVEPSNVAPLPGGVQYTPTARATGPISTNIDQSRFGPAAPASVAEAPAYDPLSGRTRMQSVARPGEVNPAPAYDPLSGRTRMESVSRTISSPAATVTERMGIPSAPAPDRFAPTGFGSASGISPDIEAGINAEAYRAAEAAELSANNDQRAALAQAARASENASMGTYNEAAALSEANARRANLNARPSEQQSIRDLGALYQSYKDAVGQIETGHKEDQYGTIGPYSQKYKSNVYGKYQVLGTNIPTWTREILGQEMTPQEFLASPAAQEAVFEDKFIGEYVAKYGLEGALQAWHGGEGSVGNPSAASPYKSNSDYVKEAMANFNAAYERNIAAAEFTDYRPDRPPGGSIDDRPTTDEEGTVPSAATTPAFNPDEAAAAAFPTDTVNPTVNLPPRAPAPTPANAAPYKRDASGFAKALGIDALGTVFGGPVYTVGNIASLLMTGDTLGGFFADASEGKYGENYYQPGAPRGERGRGGMTERGAGGYGSSTESGRQSVVPPVTTTPTKSPEEDFISKYIDFSDPTKRPTPFQKWYESRGLNNASL